MEMLIDREDIEDTEEAHLLVELDEKVSLANSLDVVVKYLSYHKLKIDKQIIKI